MIMGGVCIHRFFSHMITGSLKWDHAVGWRWRVDLLLQHISRDIHSFYLYLFPSGGEKASRRIFGCFLHGNKRSKAISAKKKRT